MIQFGEIQWWFLANTSGMAFHDADTKGQQAAEKRFSEDEIDTLRPASC